MKFPPYYAVFCLLVLGAFVYAKYEGLALFGSGGGTSGHGGHASGLYVGSHK
jgi:hypothetical protein